MDNTKEIFEELKSQKDKIFDFKEREKVIFDFYQATLKNSIDISKYLSQITGRTQRDVFVSEIVPIYEHSYYLYKNLAKVLKPKKTKKPLHLIYKRTLKYYKPYGIVLIISPYNYPFYLSLTPALYALAAGNVVLIKPSEYIKGFKDLFDMIYEKSEVKKYVKIIEGGKEKVEEIIELAPSKIFFTGGLESAKNIMKLCSDKLIPVSFELGDITPMIITKDADIKKAVNSLFFSSFFNYGQTCIATKMVYIDSDIFQDFIDEIKKNLSSLPYYCRVDTFPTSKHRETYLEKLSQKISNLSCQFIAKKETDGIDIIIADENCKLDTEIFGPVLFVKKFDNIEKVVQEINSSEFGLMCYIWSNDIKKAKDITKKINTGFIIVNDVKKDITNPYLPFGGNKKSGFGRYSAEEGLFEFSQVCSVSLSSPKWYIPFEKIPDLEKIFKTTLIYYKTKFFIEKIFKKLKEII